MDGMTLMSIAVGTCSILGTAITLFKQIGTMSAIAANNRWRIEALEKEVVNLEKSLKELNDELKIIRGYRNND